MKHASQSTGILSRCVYLLPVVAAVALLATSCAPVSVIHLPNLPGKPSVKHRHPGPPPHAPAHGYRHKHHSHGVDLIFDSGLGVYVVVDLDRVFFHQSHYYRLRDGGWSVSIRPDGGWGSVARRDLPAGLHTYGGKPGKSKKAKHGRGHGPPASHR